MKKRLVTAVLLISAFLTALKLLAMRDAHWYERLAFITRWCFRSMFFEEHRPGKHRIISEPWLRYYQAKVRRAGRQFTFAQFVVV